MVTDCKVKNTDRKYQDKQDNEQDFTETEILDFIQNVEDVRETCEQMGDKNQEVIMNNKVSEMERCNQEKEAEGKKRI